MHAGRFKREARITTNIAHLPVVRLKPIEFPMPSLDEQRRIIAVTSAKLEKVSKMGAEIDQTLARSVNLRRSLLAAAFSGPLTDVLSDLSATREMIGA